MQQSNKYPVRIASSADIPTIQKLADIAFRHTYRSIIRAEQIDYMMLWMYSEESLLSQLAQGHTYHIISDTDGRDIGYVSYNVENEDDHSIMFHLQKIYLLPDMQRKGIGRILLTHAEEAMKNVAGNKSACYELNVNRTNTALHFYERIGLTISRSGDFLIGEGFYMNDYILEKKL